MARGNGSERSKDVPEYQAQLVPNEKERYEADNKSDDWMVKYITAVNQQGGVVSIDVGISAKDGTIYPPHLKQLVAIGKGIRKGAMPRRLQETEGRAA